MAAKKSSAGSIRAAEYRISKYKGIKSDKVGSARAKGAEAMPKSPQSMRAAMKGIQSAKKSATKKAAAAPAPKARKGPKAGPAKTTNSRFARAAVDNAPGRTVAKKRKARPAKVAAPVKARNPFRMMAD